jgi:hypothetical protein
MRGDALGLFINPGNCCALQLAKWILSVVKYRQKGLRARGSIMSPRKKEPAMAIRATAPKQPQAARRFTFSLCAWERAGMREDALGLFTNSMKYCALNLAE